MIEFSTENVKLEHFQKVGTFANLNLLLLLLSILIVIRYLKYANTAILINHKTIFFSKSLLKLEIFFALTFSGFGFMTS